MKYFALLTTLGENLLAQATALGTKLELTQMAVGDGGGSLPTPDTNQTKLIAEKRRAAINTLFIDEKNPNQIIAEQIIPEQDGGWWIREIGLFDKAGNLIAVANCPETHKPQLAEGSGRTQVIRMVLAVSHTESVTLKIDPSVVLATREYVNTEITVVDKKIDALSAQTKLDLNKKFDKANISDVKGNDTAKVPSLHLLTTEIGKLQPKGEYAPAGYCYSKVESDAKYSTITALNSGLGLKLDKTSVVQSTGTSTTQVMSQDAATKAFVKPGYYGLGSIYGQEIPNNDYNLIKQSGFFAGIGGAVGTNIPPKTAFGDLRYGAVLAAFRSQQEGFTLLAHQYEIILRTFENGSWRDYVSLLTERNTKLDRNGYFRSHSSTMELEGIPIGASILWNTSAAIPENFWPNEGRSFSASTYPELAKIYPSLKLPDDRGYGIRIADNGRGIDAGRQVGTYQEDQIQNITGEWGAASGESSVTSSGAFEATYKSGGRPSGAGGGTISVKFNAGNVVRAGTETRMKNVAKILITRMK